MKKLWNTILVFIGIHRPTYEIKFNIGDYYKNDKTNGYRLNRITITRTNVKCVYFNRTDSGMIIKNYATVCGHGSINRIAHRYITKLCVNPSSNFYFDKINIDYTNRVTLFKGTLPVNLRLYDKE